MSLTDEYGQVRTHKSATRPSRRLLVGCDADKFWDLCMVGFVVALFAMMNFNLLGLIVAVGIMIGAMYFLRQLGKLNAYFFPIYKRARKEQTVYFRSAHFGARVPRIPHQQSQKEPR